MPQLTIGLAGTAGRREDGARLQAQHWPVLLRTFEKVVAENLPQGRHHIRTGGAAWVDHIGVNQFLRGLHDLTLCLPREFDTSTCRFLSHWNPDQSTPSRIREGSQDPIARTIDYYHGQFSQKMGRDTRYGIRDAIQKGARVEVYPEGTGYAPFYNRNIQVGKCDVLICITFGSGFAIQKYVESMPGWRDHKQAGLKDGGTAHCWDHSSAPLKIHVNLNLWIIEERF